MKFEKLSENKIKITFDCNDLRENNIDYQSFMSNSQASDDLFIKILDEAEKYLDFKTEHYKLEINTLALSNGNFVLIVTRFCKRENTVKIKTIHKKRKQNNVENNFSIYKFSSFDHFLDFCNFLNNNDKSSLICKLENNNSLFKYNSLYFLVINTNFITEEEKEFLYSTITEFGNFITNSSEFFIKIKENAFCFLNKNAIQHCI